MKTNTEKQFRMSVEKLILDSIPDIVIIKPDPKLKQGIPDTILLYEGRYACLEFKRSETASKRPNQEYYIEKLGKKGFATFIYPENSEEVMDNLMGYFNKKNFLKVY